MNTSLKLLTQALLLVAIPVLLSAAPMASASIVLPLQFSKASQPANLINAHQIYAGDDSALYFRRPISHGSVANVIVVDLNSRHWHLRTLVNSLPMNVAASATLYGASMAVNGGFFDVRTGQTVSYVVDKGKVVACPQDTAKKFSPQILNRSELRLSVDDNGNSQLSVARHNDKVSKGGHILESMQAGPELLPTYQPEAEAFIRKTRKGGLFDAISTTSPEARTAVGITANGKLIVVCVETPGRGPDGHGVTLLQLAHLLKGLGAVQAVNFDGGTSTSMYVRLSSAKGRTRGKVVCGASSMRRVKSVLLLLHD